MSLALFHSTLRSAVRDALADEADGWSQDGARGEPSATSARTCKVRRLNRGDLVVHAGCGAPRRAS